MGFGVGVVVGTVVAGRCVDRRRRRRDCRRGG